MPPLAQARGQARGCRRGQAQGCRRRCPCRDGKAWEEGVNVGRRSELDADMRDRQQLVSCGQGCALNQCAGPAHSVAQRVTHLGTIQSTIWLRMHCKAHMAGQGKAG